MLNIRFRDKTTAWPGFVDLFSNLVIILIFLLIVFIFLWTTTSVFNKNTGARKVAQLEQLQQAQAEQIEQMTVDKQEAEQLLIAARDALLSQESQIMTQQESQENLANAYEGKVVELTREREELIRQVETLNEQLKTLSEQGAADRQDILDQANTELNELDAKIAELENTLARAEENARKKEVEYTEMSNRLNKALAEKVAELNALGQYQSEFYKQIKTAIGNNSSVHADGDRFIIQSDILFGSGSYKVSADGKSQLKILANVIKDMESKIPSDVDWIIRIDGHTDNKPVIPGTTAYWNNMQLSLLRAASVADELIKNGVSRQRLIPTGFGDMYPISNGKDAQSLQKNRRIELQLTNK